MGLRSVPPVTGYVRATLEAGRGVPGQQSSVKEAGSPVCIGREQGVHTLTLRVHVVMTGVMTVTRDDAPVT